MISDPAKLTTIYWYCAIAGTFIFLLKTILPIDSGTEVSGDFNTADYSDSSFSLFSVEGVSAFFMVFGWVGWYAINKLNYGIPISSITAFISGVMGMSIFTYLISRFRKLEHTPKPSIKELEEKKGRAYMNFTPKGQGKIQIEFNSKLDILDAKNNTEDFIQAFDPIRVVRVENDEIYIEKDI